MYPTSVFYLPEDGHLDGQNMYDVIVYIIWFNTLVCILLVLLLYSYAPHNDVSVNDRIYEGGPIILWYYNIIL